MKNYRNIVKNKDKYFILLRKWFDKHPIIKFISIIILIVVYFILTARSYGIKDGFIISILTWSFFVLCTPVADAGILIDFPMRLITGVKMIISEIIVWMIAIGINVFVLFTNAHIYDKTMLLSLLKHIISTPFPYWGIIFLSAIGTFLSVYIADNLVKSTKKLTKQHQSLLMKYKIIIFIFLILIIIVLYDLLLPKLGVQIPTI